MSEIITPTVGRVVWFYPSLLTGEAGFAPPSEGKPLAAIVAHVWNDQLVNLAVFDANGAAHSRTSVPLLQDDNLSISHDGYFCTWMPFQKGQARAQAAEKKAEDSLGEASGACLVDDYRRAIQRAPREGTAAAPANPQAGVLYQAIRNAMEELAALHPGFNDHVNRAWNHLHRAFWSEVPAPASAPGLRELLPLSPQSVADRADSHRRLTDGGMLTFGAALEQLKAGARVARAGWNGKGQFVYLVPPASYAAQTGVAKAHFGERAMVPYNAYLALKTVDGTVSTWAPSVSDCLAEDWVVVPT